MSEEAYFYGLRNFVHFHGPRYAITTLITPLWLKKAYSKEQVVAHAD